MEVFAVFVKCDSNPEKAYAELRCRWIDSQWARMETALERVAELERMFVALGARFHKAVVVQMTVVDVKVKEKQKVSQHDR